MPEIWTVPEAVEGFLSEGLIREVLSTIKTGKEATAYLCRAAPSLHARYAVAKVYHDLEDRDFSRAAAYEEGRVILNGQVRRAVRKRTEFGRGAAVRSGSTTNTRPSVPFTTPAPISPSPTPATTAPSSWNTWATAASLRPSSST